MQKIGDQTTCEAKAKVYATASTDHKQTAARHKRQGHHNIQHASKFAQHISSRSAFPTPTGRRECCTNKASMHNKANKQTNKQANKT
eukprot:1920808-Rhodomonas_salina.1